MAESEIKHNNPLNNSTSKQQFSFSKLNRFNNRVRTEGTDTYYELPDTKDKKTFSFGKEHHKIKINTHVSPPPGSYEVEGDFERIIRKKEGGKITYGREVRPLLSSNARQPVCSHLLMFQDPAPTSLILNSQKQKSSGA